MKSIIFISAIFVCSLFSLISSQPVVGVSGQQEQCSPNDIFTVLFTGIEKDYLQLPRSELIFNEVQDNKIKRIIENELPIHANKVSTGKSLHKCYSYTQVYYDGFHMVYKIKIGPVLSRDYNWDGKLYNVLFSLRLKTQNISSDNTKVFSKLTKLYGNHKWKEPFRFWIRGEPIEANPNLSLYVWETPNIVITYRSFYSLGENATVIVVEYWDRSYYESHNYWEEEEC